MSSWMATINRAYNAADTDTERRAVIMTGFLIEGQEVVTMRYLGTAPLSTYVAITRDKEDGVFTSGVVIVDNILGVHFYEPFKLHHITRLEAYKGYNEARNKILQSSDDDFPVTQRGNHDDL